MCFGVSRFSLPVGKDLRMEVGPSELGIGHCADGAVWAVLIPRTGRHSHQHGHRSKRISLTRLAAVSPQGNQSPIPAGNCLRLRGNQPGGREIRSIADYKMDSSLQAYGNALIPEPKVMIADVDTRGTLRRFFVVDTEAQTAEYKQAFTDRALKLPPVITPALAEAAFDKLWEAFDRDYAMFTLRPEVDWAKLREQYRPLALESKSTQEFAATCAVMLKNLRDLHVWLKVADADVPVFNRPRSANSNPAAHAALLGDLHKAGRVLWAVTPDKIGFIAVYGWNDVEHLPAQCGEALEHMRDTRGLIVDVRLNGGGGEPLAKQFASRFLKEEFVYAYCQVRNGPRHSDLAENRPRKIAPQGPWRYDRPVVVLIGQKCMSSNESFIAMMSGDPDVTTMGDHTCGSSGNPEMIDLPSDMTVSVPQWIDFLPDGTPLDERGCQPQIPFKPTPGAFADNRDDLLTAALDRLRKAPLPEQPIPGPAFVPE